MTDVEEGVAAGDGDNDDDDDDEDSDDSDDGDDSDGDPRPQLLRGLVCAGAGPAAHLCGHSLQHDALPQHRSAITLNIGSIITVKCAYCIK